ncbi:MAG: hypothetical protein HY775_07185 [Acidobacteria bacterium]|nr:hypothetical protein [Acidobacteriota bacterium]
MVASTIEVDAFLADSVVVAEGKLFTQGAGWNIINTQGLPARHDRIGVGILVRVPYTATCQKHRLEIRLEDEDGARVSLGDAREGGRIDRIEAEFNVGRPPNLPHGDEQNVPFAININGLAFENAGAFRFVIAVDTVDAKELPFRVAFLQPPMIRPMTQQP